MSALLVTITTQQPVLASALEGDPNSGETFPYIPGSVLRGALIARYTPSINLGDANIKRLFFSDAVRFLHAYPLENDQRAIPLPRLLPENPSAPSADAAHENAASSDPPLKNKGLPIEWLVNDSNGAYTFRTTRHLNIHTTRNRAKGRSTRDNGAVYRYVAIAPQQLFQAVILGAAADLQTFKTLLDQQPRLWLGGARSAGYGEVTIACTLDDAWRHETANLPATSTTVTMTLLSDAIVRDGDGQYARSLSGAMFGLLNATINWQRSAIKYTVVGGFNRTWGLPLPQTPALAAGSVLTWDNVQPADLALLVERGIGERRNEGYGRISFAPTLQEATRTATKLQYRETLPPAQLTPSISIFPAATQTTLTMLGTRLLRQKLDQQLVTLIASYRIKRTTTTRNSLFGRVELWARRMWEQVQRDPNAAGTHFTLLAQNASRVAQIARTNLRTARLDNGESLATVLDKTLADVMDIWRIDAVKLGDDTFPVTNQLAAEYQARLIIAIVTMARKPRDEPGGVNG